MKHALIAALALLPLCQGASAAPAPWANAGQVKATDTRCGPVRSLTLGKAGTAPAGPAGEMRCETRVETLDQVFVSGKFLPRGKQGPIAETDVDVRYVACRKGGGMIILGPAADTERAMREHPAQPGCKVSKIRYQQVSSAGIAGLVDIVEPKMMSVSESVDMHVRQNNKMIADCNASPSCRADQNRMRSGSGKTFYTCPPGYYLGGSSDNPYATCVPIR